MFLIILFCVLGISISEAQTIASPPVRLSLLNSIRLTPEVLRLGSKLRVRNISAGTQIVLNLNPEQTNISISELSSLVASEEQEALLEFSILRVSRTKELILPPNALRNSGEDVLRMFEGSTQLQWKVLGYRVLRTKSGEVFMEVSDRLKTLFITPEQSYRRLQVTEERNLKRLFELAWRAISIEQYELAREGFQKILERESRLNFEQKAQVHLGLATSKYHLQGCGAEVNAHFIEADRDAQNRDDVSYYRALCSMTQKDFVNAEILFKDLVLKRHPGYSEASAFYLGVIAEEDERYDEAESAYMDTIDFSSDKALIELAQQRLENVRELQKYSSYGIKWISGGLSASGAYDSNVIALPSGVSPSSFGLSKEASLLMSHVAFLSLSPPWSSSLQNNINYSFLMNMHFEKEIGNIYDSNAHDVGTQFQFNTSDRSVQSLGGSWTRVATGILGQSEEALKTYMGYYQYRRMLGSDPLRPDQVLDLTLKYLAIRPSVAPVSATRDLHANSYTLQFKFSRREDAPHVHGPEAQIEYRPSKGIENSLWDYRLGGFWDYTFNGGNSAWYLSQRGYFSYKPYFESVSNRHDYTFNYMGALGRTWGSHFDTRLQFQGNLNFSTRQLDYQYQQAALSLLVTAYF